MDKESFRQGYWYGMAAGAIAHKMQVDLNDNKERTRFFETHVDLAYHLACDLEGEESCET